MEMKQYYWSNDDTPFQTIMMPEELTTNKYPIVVETPDPSLKSPKYDWAKNQWIENDAQSQGEQLAVVKQDVQSVKADVESLQQAHTDAVKQDNKTNEKLDGLTKLVAMTNTNVAKIMAMTTKEGDK